VELQAIVKALAGQSFDPLDMAGATSWTHLDAHHAAGRQLHPPDIGGIERDTGGNGLLGRFLGELLRIFGSPRAQFGLADFICRTAAALGIRRDCDAERQQQAERPDATAQMSPDRRNWKS